MYNSIDRQIACVDNLIRYVKQVSLDASTIQYQVMEAMQKLREKGLPSDLLNKYLADYWKHIEDCHKELENRIETHDLPHLWELSNHLDNLRK